MVKVYEPSFKMSFITKNFQIYLQLYMWIIMMAGKLIVFVMSAEMPPLVNLGLSAPSKK